jgi:signal transduction histidine kinase
MLNKTGNRIRIPYFLDVATYVGAAAMSLLGISGLPSLRSKLIALGLCLIFGLLYRFLFRTGRYAGHPNIYFGAQGFVLALLFLLGSNSSDAFNFLFLLLSIHVALVLTGKTAAIWITLYFGIVSTVILITRGTDGIYAVLFYSVTYIVCGFFGSVLRQAELARDHNQRLVDELQATQRKLQELAVVEERNRLARDLHDSVKQQVFAILMQLGAARALLNEGDQAYGPMTEAERLARQAGAELTTLIRELRPPGLESKSLAAALQEYITEWSRQNGIAAALKVDGDSSIPLPGDETLFRVAQEALANVARHSKAGNVTVTLANQREETMLIVEDDGAGFDMGHVEKGVGLDSMRERLEAIGGQLNITSQKSGGTRIMATLARGAHLPRAQVPGSAGEVRRP